MKPTVGCYWNPTSTSSTRTATPFTIYREAGQLLYWICWSQHASTLHRTDQCWLLALTVNLISVIRPDMSPTLNQWSLTLYMCPANKVVSVVCQIISKHIEQFSFITGRYSSSWLCNNWILAVQTAVLITQLGFCLLAFLSVCFFCTVTSWAARLPWTISLGFLWNYTTERSFFSDTISEMFPGQEPSWSEYRWHCQHWSDDGSHPRSVSRRKGYGWYKRTTPP